MSRSEHQYDKELTSARTQSSQSRCPVILTSYFEPLSEQSDKGWQHARTCLSEKEGWGTVHIRTLLPSCIVSAWLANCTKHFSYLAAFCHIFYSGCWAEPNAELEPLSSPKLNLNQNLTCLSLNRNWTKKLIVVTHSEPDTREVCIKVYFLYMKRQTRFLNGQKPCACG